MDLPVSPLAPERFPDMPAIPGVRLATCATGVKYKGRDDLLLALLAPDTAIAGVLTTSRTASAPVLWCRRQLAHGRARAIIVNAGNANAFTGRAGAETVRETVSAAARHAACAPEEIFVASTGVIGEPLDARLLTRHFDALFARAGSDSPAGWEAAARAIMTTDTFPKGATAQAEIGGVTVRLCGIAKGSGMIAPNMATMLAFLFTDARLPAPVLQEMLAAAADRTFNCITVDGDTSTSDTVLLAATGQAENPVPERADAPQLSAFREALEDVCRDLATQIVRDGEGAEKFVTIRVRGAGHDAAARQIAMSIANSPLVKTAIAGEDPNWGRIVMAVGKAGVDVAQEDLVIRIGGILVARDGAVAPGYDEAPVAAHMKGRYIDIEVEVGSGSGAATVWTCDLTHRYIDINADYRS
jgi:glutamate N-acetyltransferase/amino-acid N-acetyltransferase